MDEVERQSVGLGISLHSVRLRQLTVLEADVKAHNVHKYLSYQMAVGTPDEHPIAKPVCVGMSIHQFVSCW